MIGARRKLSIEERGALAGKWIALEIYASHSTMKRIEAIGASVVDCVTQLQERDHGPRALSSS